MSSKILNITPPTIWNTCNAIFPSTWQAINGPVKSRDCVGSLQYYMTLLVHAYQIISGFVLKMKELGSHWNRSWGGWSASGHVILWYCNLGLFQPHSARVTCGVSDVVANIRIHTTFQLLVRLGGRVIILETFYPSSNWSGNCVVLKVEAVSTWSQ